jgi:nitrogenase molybdenum-iron protein alpha chain
VSQSLGHHIANDAIRDHIFEKAATEIETTPYDITIIGDYNIGGDAWASRRILEEMGLRVIAQWTGDATMAELANAPQAKLNLIHCYRSMNYICRYMEDTWGIPWEEYNFFGPTKIYESIRKIAAHFDETIQANAEALIEKMRPEMDAIIAEYKPRLEGKTVMLYVGGLRPRHVIGAYEDLGMEIIAAGYEFGHNDEYKRTYPLMPEGAVIMDDATPYELEEFTKALKPDLVGSGIKEKYAYHKMGVPFRQMHSWDYSGPYHGFDGFSVFARDMDMTVNSPVWGLVRKPGAASVTAAERAAS